LAESVGRCLEQSAVASGYSDRTASQLYPPSQSPAASPSATVAATVVTFFPHPREYFSGQSRPLLTPLEEKSLQLAYMGVDQLVLLPFNQFLAELSAEDFVEQILINGLQTQQISVGNDFHFGKGRQGNAQVLKEIAARHGIDVHLVSLINDDQGRISSSRIRTALAEGDTTTVTALLGRPYSLSGRVSKENSSDAPSASPQPTSSYRAINLCPAGGSTAFGFMARTTAVRQCPNGG